MIDRERLAKTIESTLLKPTASCEDVTALCTQAIHYGFAGVCVAPTHAKLVVEFLAVSDIKVVSVAGFPLGNQTTTTKAAEVAELVELGVDEIDVVVNIGMVLEKRAMEVASELGLIRRVAGDATLKVILETATLEHPRVIKDAAAIAVGAGADYLKTSTGFGPAGASVEHVKLLCEAARGRCGVKAAGGIGDLNTALAMIEAGANRIGTSSAAAIMDEAQAV